MSFQSSGQKGVQGGGAVGLSGINGLCVERGDYPLSGSYLFVRRLSAATQGGNGPVRYIRVLCVSFPGACDNPLLTFHLTKMKPY